MAGKLFGVGICDADYNVQEEEDRQAGNRKVTWRCPYYQTWLSLIRRSYSKKQKERSPTYQECYVDTVWHRFSSFRSWMLEQPLHDLWLAGNINIQVDKDFLVPGNKMYAPDRCILLPSYVNCIVTGQNRKIGDLPLGVSFKKKNNAYQSQIMIAGDKKYLGLFENPMDAHLRWQLFKHPAILDEMDKYSEISGYDDRVVQTLKNIALRLSEDIYLGRETTHIHA